MQEPINTADLVDIRKVQVDNTLPKEARITEYIRQIKDPYHFKCGNFAITAKFAEGDSPTLEDCLQRLMA